jgi:DNA-binding beta-propeller fold protein YncE
MLRRPLAAVIGIVVVVAAAATAAVAAVRQTHDALPLAKVHDVSLPGTATRFDYQSVDSKRRRLFIAHLGAGQLISFDLSKQRVAGVVGGVDDVRGVLAVPPLGLVYAAATGRHSLVTFDERTLRRKAIAPAGDFPDGVAYDPGTERVFVSDVSGEQETAFRARTGRRIGAIPLGGDPGNVQYDARSKRILVTVGSRDELAVLDPRRLRVVKRAHLDGCEHPHGLEVASAWRRAYAACEDNATLVVVDLRSLKTTGSVSVGDDPDVLDLDPQLRRLYVAAESGVVAAFDVRSGIRKLGEDRLDPHAHSVAVDPRTHRVYFPLENVDGHPVLRVMRPR